MPQNTNILLIRHGEKPPSAPTATAPSDPFLTVPGQERAQAYIIYFQNYVINNGAPLKLNYLFAAADSTASERPRLTIQPLAQALNLQIDAKHKDTDYEAVAHDILQNAKYQDANILICWHHEQILDLAACLCGNTPPTSTTWPPGWPGDVYGWVLQICFDPSGQIDQTQTRCLNEHLMYDDHGKEPPNG